MKIHRISSAAMLLGTLAGMPMTYAQGVFIVTPPPRPHSSSPVQTIPSSPILPMTNPIAPMMRSPIQPIVPLTPQTPFVRHDTIPTVVFPETSANLVSRYPVAYPFGYSYGYPDGQGRDVTIVVPGGTVIAPSSNVIVVPNAGQERDARPAEGRNRRFERVGPVPAQNSLDPVPYVSPVIPMPPAPPLPVIESAPVRMNLQAPPIGISRSEVLMRLGEPYGSMRARGSESLYFNGLVVVLEGDRVIQVR